jgi:dTDP-4-dehydrorhamnose reductase
MAIELNNALITGGSGMIGNNIHFGYKPSSSEMNVCDIDSVSKYIDFNKNISCIIHLAAINLRESDNDIKKAIDVNINGTSNLLYFAKKYNIPFILVSTGAVFSSNNENNKFEESHITCPNSIYGYTKEASEKIALLYEKSIVIRTGWLFGGNQKNHYKFVETVINHFITNNTIKASNDFYGSPTYVIDFINKMKDIIYNEIYGIHHVVNSDFGNGYDIANEIADILNVDKNLILSKPCELIPNSKKRSCTEMLITKNDFNKLRSWKIALKEYCEKYISIKKMNTNKVFTNKWKHRENCRLCNKYNLKIFYNLNPTPPANNFVNKYTIQHNIPLDIAVCLDCHHIQLIQIVEPSMLYSNYVYVSSTSNTMIRHLQNSVMEFVSELKINKNDYILEIGANDGVCIKHLLDNNFTNVIGVDPAENINKTHNLPILCDFFSSKIIHKLKKYKLIYAFHCCAHIEDIQDVFNTVYQLLEDNGSFIMEVGYFYEVYKKKMFDTIYHEHIDYHTVTALQNFASLNNLIIYKVKHNNIQSGSIQFFICKKSMNQEVDSSVKLAIDNERKINLFNYNKLSNWKINIIKCGIDIHNILNSFKDYGKKIVGYGASAKSTTFLYQYNITNKVLDFIIDDNKYKQNLYSPGLNIPIKDISILDIEKVDYIIILSFNFINEILKKIKKYRTKGIRVIIPFPQIKII